MDQTTGEDWFSLLIKVASLLEENERLRKALENVAHGLAYPSSDLDHWTVKDAIAYIQTVLT
jgi:hypothetical protein